MYKILCKDGSAKRGRLETVHGTIETPVFMNVATVGAMERCSFDGGSAAFENTGCFE